MQAAAILILATAVVGFGVLLRMQNLGIADLTQSVATLSSLVRDHVKAGQDVAAQPVAPEPSTAPTLRLANPASTNCLEKGGQLEIKDGPAGQYGICFFEDNRQCEEWALFRGDCPVGGRKVTGYMSDATVYCAITGHEAVEGSQPGQDGTCKVDGVTCLAQEFYEKGTCAAAGAKP